MIISNASPLMYLSKLNKLDLLKLLEREIFIPREVYEEVVIKGKNEGFLDAYNVEKAIEEGLLKIKEIPQEEKLEKFALEIHKGEVAVITLAKKLKPNLLLIDDASARIIAESLGFNVKGTLYILLNSYRKRKLSKEETKKLINHLITLGFRISNEFYIQLMDELEKGK